MIIETEGLTKRFGRKDAVSAMNLRVAKGAAMAMIGANGAGKTTTLRLLTNIYSPDAGRAEVLGIDTRKLRQADFQRIGFVSENQKLPTRLTVAQYFDYLRPMYESWDGDLEARLRRELDLPPGRRIGALSHGMRIKLMLAGALPFRPELLLLDEPLSGLDPLIRDEVIEGVLGQAEDTTIVISSHELAEIEGFATDVAYIEDGALKFQESTEDLRRRFRAITATFAKPPAPIVTDARSRWLSLQAQGHTLSFIDAGFKDEASLAGRIAALAGPVEQLQTAPLSLRDISKALMRAARQEAHS
jgi:ABC-2 type transport system ATP-binding protein